MKVILHNGLPAITDNAGNVLVSALTPQLRHADFPGGPQTFTDITGEWTLSETENGYKAVCGTAVLNFRHEGEGMGIQCDFTAHRTYASVDSFAITSQLSDHPRALIAPRLSGCNGNRLNEMLSPVVTTNLGEDGSFQCGDYGAFQGVSGKCYVAGFISYRENFGSVVLFGTGVMQIIAFTEHHAINEGETYSTDIFYFNECESLQKGLPEYADRTALEMIEGGYNPRFDTPVGFCSWYYYLHSITSDMIGNSVADAAKYKEQLPIKYIQIDSGWYGKHGDWEANAKFEKGMKAEADRIREAGFVPGIWFAPLIVEPDSKLAIEHPDWMLRDWGGETPRYGDYSMFNLDISKKESQEYMAEIFRRATEDWGFEYLKLDGITASIGPYKHADPSFNALKSFRKIMQIARDSTPEGTFILACTAPFGAVAGIADGVRTSTDVGGDWPSVGQMYNDIFKRWFYGNRMFICDADVLIVRKGENEDSECQRGCTRTDDEIRTYMSATAASGGILMLSDKLSLLSDEQIKELSCMFPVNKIPAVPVDLLTSPIPEVLDNGLRGKNHVMVLINWTDEAKTYTVDAENAHVYGFWAKEYHGVCEKEFTIELRPHASEVLFITKADEAAVVATDSALTPEIEQSYDNGKLNFTFEKAGETLYIAAEELSCDGLDVKKLDNGLFAVTQSGEKMTHTVIAK